jgi:Tfp pilus assembly protein PilP
MTRGKVAAYGVGAALLVACIAAANLPTDEPAPARDARQAPAGPAALAGEVNAQAARLQARMAQAPVPDSSPRNPFAFGLPARGPAAANAPAGMVRAAVAPDAAPVAYTPPLPALTLMGIAEETTSEGPRRTAVIGGDGDTIYMVAEGQTVGTRYKVTKIGADAIELEDLLTKGYRRIALR